MVFRLGVRLAGDKLLVLLVTVGLATGDQVILHRDLRQVLFDRIDDACKVGLHRQGLGIGVVHDIDDLTADQPEIDRHDDDAGFGRGQKKFHQLDAVVHEYSDFIAFGQS